MTTKLASDVREFMRAFGQEVRETPGIPSDDVVRLRARLVVEECFEMLEAMFPESRPWFDEMRDEVFGMIRNSKPRVDLVELADALGDLDYVVEGARADCGLDGVPIADVIHASNLAKTGGPVVDGKIKKPEGWSPPDILGELMKQGWSE